jgi:AcrR family transcriptional regulator
MVDDLRSRWSPRQVALLDDLERLFASEGFRHLTIADMAARTRCSRRTLYSIASSKEELVVVVLDRYFNRMGKDARLRAERVVDVRDKVEAYFSASVERSAHMTPLFLEDIEGYLPTKQLYDRHQALAVGALEGMFRDAMEAGNMRKGSPALVAEIVDAVIKRLRDADTLAKVGATRADVLTAFAQLCREGLV